MARKAGYSSGMSTIGAIHSPIGRSIKGGGRHSKRGRVKARRVR